MLSRLEQLGQMTAEPPRLLTVVFEYVCRKHRTLTEEEFAKFLGVLRPVFTTAAKWNRFSDIIASIPDAAVRPACAALMLEVLRRRRKRTPELEKAKAHLKSLLPS